VRLRGIAHDDTFVAFQAKSTAVYLTVIPPFGLKLDSTGTTFMDQGL